MLIRSNACIIMLLSNLFVFYQVTYVWATSKTWTQTLKNLDPEKPGPRKPGSWKTWILKNLHPEKLAPRKTWTLCLELKVWVSSFLNIRGSRLEMFLKFLQNSLNNIKNIRDAAFHLKFQAKRSTTLLKRDSGLFWRTPTDCYFWNIL